MWQSWHVSLHGPNYPPHHVTHKGWFHTNNRFMGRWTHAVHAHLESPCKKFILGHIEWSPSVGLWLSRQWLLHRVSLWMIGDCVPDPRNRFRDCLKLGLPDPWTSTYGTICAHILVTNWRSNICQKLPQPSNNIISSNWLTAECNNDHIRAKAITEIII